jgi:hypothetical protein
LVENKHINSNIIRLFFLFDDTPNLIGENTKHCHHWPRESWWETFHTSSSFFLPEKTVQGDVIRGTAKQHGFIWFHIILEFWC